MVEKNIARLYEVLELEPYASKDEIKKAYKKLVKKYHPDLYQNKTEKKAAEEKFKLINEAYQYLINNNVTDNDYRYRSQEDFSEFFTRQVDDDFDDFINEETGDDYEHLLKRAIKFVEQEMKSQKIEKLVAFDRISRDKSIFNWDINEYTTSTINDYLIKETLYRRHIKESKEYKGFIKNKKLYSHLNIDAVLIVGNKYKKKMFNDNIVVDYKAICSNCCGVGCNKCNQQGVVNKQKKVLVKAPVTDEKKFYEIANGGHETVLGNGSLLITLVKKNIDIDFELKQKHSVASAFNPLLNFGDQVWDMIVKFYQLCWTHKHHTILYFTIICLLIVIICLAVLL